MDTLVGILCDRVHWGLREDSESLSNEMIDDITGFDVERYGSQ